MFPNLTLAEVIGYMAAFLTTVSFVPQTVKILRERQTRGISLHMYAVFTMGLLCWLVHGLMIGNWPMILANSVTLVLAGVVLVMKVRLG